MSHIVEETPSFSQPSSLTHILTMTIHSIFIYSHSMSYAHIVRFCSIFMIPELTIDCVYKVAHCHALAIDNCNVLICLIVVRATPVALMEYHAVLARGKS